MMADCLCSLQHGEFAHPALETAAYAWSALPRRLGIRHQACPFSFVVHAETSGSAEGGSSSGSDRAGDYHASCLRHHDDGVVVSPCQSWFGTAFAGIDKKGDTPAMHKIKIGLDGTYEYKHGDPVPAVKCLIEKAQQQLQQQLDDVEEEIRAVRNAEQHAAAGEEQVRRAAKDLENPNFPHRLLPKQVENAAAQAHLEMQQDAAIMQLPPLLERKKVIIEDLEKLGEAYQRASGCEDTGTGKKRKKEAGHLRVRPYMVGLENEAPPRWWLGGTKVFVPEAFAPSLPAPQCKTIPRSGSRGLVYQQDRALGRDNNGNGLPVSPAPLIHVKAPTEDQQLDVPSVADENSMPMLLLAAAPLLASLRASVVKAAMQRSRRHEMTRGFM